MQTPRDELFRFTQKMRLHPEPFERIKSGEKNIECRLNDKKRQQLAVGDTVVFENRGDG